MYTILLGTIVGAIAGVLIMWSAWKEFGDETFGGFIIGAIAGALVGTIVLVILTLSYEDKKYSTLIGTYELECIQDGSSVEGRFFVGSGYVGESMKHSFYYKQGGGYRFKQISASNSFIEYGDKPMVYVYDLRYPDNLSKWVVDKTKGKEVSYKIIVPKGTIKQDYSLDAK